MLKDGSFVIADAELRNVVKYAQERMGRNYQTAGNKKRRTCLDGEGTAEVAQSKKDEYNGYFKVRLSADNLFVEVVNGRDPEYQYCGRCDLPGNYDVKSVKFPITIFQSSRVYISICIGASWSSDTGYQSHIFVYDDAYTYLPEEMKTAERFCVYLCLGTVYSKQDSNGIFSYIINQDYKADSEIRFGDAYIL